MRRRPILARARGRGIRGARSAARRSYAWPPKCLHRAPSRPECCARREELCRAPRPARGTSRASQWISHPRVPAARANGARKSARSPPRLLPLHSRNRGLIQSPAIARAFQRIDHGVCFEFRKISQVQGGRVFHFAADGELPLLWVERRWFVHVVANKEAPDRRKPGVEIFDRRLKIEEAERAQDLTVCAFNVELWIVGSPREQRRGCSRGQRRPR